jgi:glycosyltransferase involved in cell wall biosynthesis
MASLSEGFSLPPLEAAACGCPVVCTDCGGPADYVIEGSNGYIVPIRDFQTMADRIISVLSRPEADWIAMSRAATTKAQRFDWDTSALRLESVLSEALK